MNFQRFILLLGIAFIVHSCAVQKSPLGGPKDEDPPVIDTLASTPNFQTNFKEEQILLKFDEFVQLKNAFEQVVYSPPLRVKPEMIQRGKKIKLKFSKEDSLKDNTTYTINFGEAIQDFNESNILSNYRFVFSTGDIIDSLEISGKVMDDMTSEPAEDVLVLLYDNLSDSIVYKEQPYYFAKTDEGGNFKIQNLRSDTFKVFVLKDGNLNLKYEEGEPMGFLDTFIFVNDSLPPPLSLNIFEPIPALILTDDEIFPYKIKFEFNRDPFDLEIDHSEDSIWWKKETFEDSILLWHDNSVTADSFFLSADGKVLDTILFKPKTPKQTELSALTVLKKNSKRNGALKTGENLTLEFALPIKSIDTSKLSLSDTLTRYGYSFFIDSLSPRKVDLEFNYRYGDTLNFSILPGGLEFINGATNDTIEEKIIPQNPELFGLINLAIDSLDSDASYVMQLMDGDKVIKEEVIVEKRNAIFVYRNMDPKEYTVKLILDANRNGKWDPGNYELRSQSETWKEFSLEALRENWELDANVTWKQ